MASLVQSLSLLEPRSLDKTRKSGFLSALEETLYETGFVRFRHHGLPPELITAAYAEATKFFALSPASKERYARPEIGGQRGYITFGQEHAKDRPDLADLKEFWHHGPELEPRHPYYKDYEKNIYPEEVPGFQPLVSFLYRELIKLANEILDYLSVLLGHQNWWLRTFAKDGDTLLRILHYPALERLSFPPGAIRSGEHEDIGLMTLLTASNAAGLQVKTRSGDWIDVGNDPGELVMNLGDLFQHLAGGHFLSTTHRVVNPAEGNMSRMSVPFFVHPHPLKMISVVPKFSTPEREERYPPHTAGYLLEQRLIEIGVLKRANRYAS
jgi:isopenicillin N synthase-like dioxygenase